MSVRSLDRNASSTRAERPLPSYEDLRQQRGLPRRRRAGSWLGDLTKRSLDVVIALIALVFLMPLWGLIALAIKRDSPGPVIYRGTRVGRGGKPFQILKFRTMYETPESYSGPKVTAHDDPRVTPTGRWLRATKLNELPQLWNVLIGEMSLVGPRPEDPTFAMSWPRGVWEAVLSVRPGITSPASVVYHNEEALLCQSDNVFRQYVQEVGPDKMRLDQLYVRHRSFCLDLDTLLWTTLILLPRVRSFPPPEALLFVGPITRLLRHVSWFVVDSVVAFVAVGCTGLLWRIHVPLNLGWPKAVTVALGFAFLFSVTGAILGVNRIAWSKAAPSDVLDLVVAWIVASTIAFIANLSLRLLPPELVLLASVLALSGFVVVRYRSRLATGLVSHIIRHRVGARTDPKRVLIIGAGRNAQYATWLLSHPANSEKFQIVGLVDDDLFNQGMRIYGANVVGTCRDTARLVAEQRVGMIVLADREITQEQYRSIREICNTAPASFMDFHCLDCLAAFGTLQETSPFPDSHGMEAS
jgi:lipopolysaccharide/colanic/teichoic acid biosynthesis glycosyltransferase